MDRKAKAKAIVINGGTLKAASRETGLSMDQLKKYSSNENWIEQQNEYYNALTDELLEELGEQHILARVKAFNICEKIIKDTDEIIKADVIGKEAANKLKLMDSVLNIINKAIGGESKILNLIDVNVLYKAVKAAQGENEDNKTMNIQEVEKVLTKIKGVRISKG